MAVVRRTPPPVMAGGIAAPVPAHMALPLTELPLTRDDIIALLAYANEPPTTRSPHPPIGSHAGARPPYL
eukprot:6286542-Amphidinium_carterae.1